MRMIFDLHKFKESNLETDKVCEEVMMVGFTAELIEMIENDQEELMRRKTSRRGSGDSHRSHNDEIQISPNIERKGASTPNVIK